MFSLARSPDAYYRRPEAYLADDVRFFAAAGGGGDASTSPVVIFDYTLPSCRTDREAAAAVSFSRPSRSPDSKALDSRPGELRERFPRRRRPDYRRRNTKLQPRLQLYACIFTCWHEPERRHLNHSPAGIAARSHLGQLLQLHLLPGVSLTYCRCARAEIA